jgi:hypothetical protein
VSEYGIANSASATECEGVEHSADRRRQPAIAVKDSEENRRYRNGHEREAAAGHPAEIGRNNPPQQEAAKPQFLSDWDYYRGSEQSEKNPGNSLGYRQ